MCLIWLPRMPINDFRGEVGPTGDGAAVRCDGEYVSCTVPCARAQPPAVLRKR